MDTAFGLYLPEYTIPAPAVQTNFVKIIGRDGSVDLSNALGLHYDSRTWSLDFKCFDPTVNWHTLSSQVMNAIHGKRLNFEFDDDPNYFWTGRVSVQNYVSNHGTGTLKVTIVSDPFKYAKLSTIVTKTASTGTEYTGELVTFNTANAKINDLSVTMQPIQDLHGYANPWPAGGGKNKFGLPAQTKTNNGCTLTIDSNGMFTVSGTPSVVATFSLNFVFSEAGTFTLSTSKTFSSANNGIRAYATLKTSDSGSWEYPTFSSIPATRTFTDGKIAQIHIEVKTTFTTDITFGVQLESGSSATSWTPYSNICPISGRTGLSVYVSPTQDVVDATTYAVDWTSEAGTVYGGTLDVVTGVLTVDRANIASYNGETINEPWLSSMDAYTHGATPTTGAQVVYKLATPLTYQLTGQEVEALVGTNNVWSDGGNVTVAVVTPETLTNNGRAVVPTLTASADMVLKWGNYSASVQQGTSTIPQLILENGANLIYIIGTGSISFTWQEASL